MSDSGNQQLRIVAVLGSARSGNMTARALHLLIDELEKDSAVEVELVDPAKLQLGWPGGRGNAKEAERLRDSVSVADGIVFATPEYHGSYSSVVKMVIENLGFPSTLAGKPAVILGVAAGAIGAIKALEHLRSVLSHIGVLVLPRSVSIPGVHEVFDESGACRDAAIEERIRGLATALLVHLRS